jgi:hypothetical protein
LSFDVYLQHFERGQPAEADRAAVAVVLREREARGPDDNGLYHLPIGDLWTMVKGRSGPVVELEILGGPKAVPGRSHEPYVLAVSAGDLDGEEEFTGCAFFLHAFSPDIADVIFSIAQAGGMAIIPAAETGALLPPSADPGDLPEEMSHPLRIASGRELFFALNGEYVRYERWRDRVIPGAGRKPLLPRLARRIRVLRRKRPTG